MKGRIVARFIREELKQVALIKGEDGKYYTRTLWLDKDSLQVHKVLTVFTATSLDTVCAMYLYHFKEGRTLAL